MKQNNFQYGDFHLVDGNLYYRDTLVAKAPLVPLYTAGGDNVYVYYINKSFPWLIIFEGSDSPTPSFYECSSIELSHRRIDFKTETNKMRISQFGPYEYPHEDSDYTKLVIDYIG